MVATRTPISARLRKIVADIHTSGDVNLTRLTILKRWFEMSPRISVFGMFVAFQALGRPRKDNAESRALFQEADALLAGVDMFQPKLSDRGAFDFHRRLVAFQNEHKGIPFGSVRQIRDWNLMLLEYGLILNLRNNLHPTEPYRVAVDYCQHYDPRYGNGLNGPSAQRIEEIAAFADAREAWESSPDLAWGRPGVREGAVCSTRGFFTQLGADGRR